MRALHCCKLLLMARCLSINASVQRHSLRVAGISATGTINGRSKPQVGITDFHDNGLNQQNPGPGCITMLKVLGSWCEEGCIDEHSAFAKAAGLEKGTCQEKGFPVFLHSMASGIFVKIEDVEFVDVHNTGSWKPDQEADECNVHHFVDHGICQQLCIGEDKEHYAESQGITYGTCDFSGYTKYILEKQMKAYATSYPEANENDRDNGMRGTEIGMDDEAAQAFSYGGGILTRGLKRRLRYGSHAQDDIQNFWNGLQVRGTTSLADIFDVEAPFSRNAADEHSEVFQAKYRDSGSKVVLKLIPTSTAENQNSIAEWYISKYLRERNVQGVVGVDQQAFAVNRQDAPEVVRDQLPGSEEHFLCFVEPLMPWGTLEKNLEQLSTQMVFKCLTDVASTLAVMHRNHVYHNDMGSDNILLDKQGGKNISAKICDFGSAAIAKDPEASRNDVTMFGETLAEALYIKVVGDASIQLGDKDKQAFFDRLTRAVGKDEKMQKFLSIYNHIKDSKGRLQMSDVAHAMATAYAELG